jgi:hypothetical protein
MTAMLTGIELYAIEPKHIVGLGFFYKYLLNICFAIFIFSNLIGIMTAFIFLNRRVDESIQLTVGYYVRCNNGKHYVFNSILPH